MEDLEVMYEPLPSLIRILPEHSSSDEPGVRRFARYRVNVSQWFSKTVYVLAVSDADAAEKVGHAWEAGNLSFESDDAYDFPDIESCGVD